VKRDRTFVTRLDVWLAENGLAESREKAQALVMAGRVTLNGQRASKPGTRVKDDSRIVVDPGPAHVGRGATKLAAALDAFVVTAEGRVAVDVGASTGGFTETLLARGATRVYAVDVGRGQLHERLRTDPRVVVLDRTNARTLSPERIPEPCAIASMDVSFISVRKILPALRSVLAPGADVVVLVKPQFEVGRFQVGRGGIVKDPVLHRQALRDVAEAAREQGYAVRGACASPITGAEGNREFFLHLVPEGPPVAPDDIETLLRKAVEA
jgi:23S rRNA (cytidine1920-2'-O)/16S rRNA (cytidine1409-2'-O)-methyltransferase